MHEETDEEPKKMYEYLVETHEANQKEGNQS